MNARHPISLEHLTVQPADPPELIRIAAKTGCQMVYVSARPTPGTPGAFELTTQPDLVRETRRLAGELGVEIRNFGSVRIHPEFEMDSLMRMIEAALGLGAKNLLLNAYDPDANRSADTFLEICAAAAAAGLGVQLEPVSYASVTTLEQAAALALSAKNPKVGLLVDVLHLHRAGQSVADLARIDPGLIHYAQICDGPRRMPADKRMEEARLERQLPGKGELPLVDFINALPQGIPLGIEAPSSSLAHQGRNPLEIATLAVNAARQLLQ